MNLNYGCVIKYYVLIYSGLCWVLNKICRFKCGNNTKTETAFKKNSILGLGSYQNRSKKRAFGLGCNQNRGQKGIEFFFKKKSPYGLGCSENRGKRQGLWPRVQWKPRQKGPLWLRFLTEAKSYALLASPQYASVPEPVQNIKNNRYQRPFLHWWKRLLTSDVGILLETFSSWYASFLVFEVFIGPNSNLTKIEI